MSSENNNKTRDMTSGDPTRLILQFAIPLFIGNVFQQIYTIADTMIAGYNLGDGAIAAIGATSSIYSLLINIASGLNSGYGIVIARMFGAHDDDGLRRSIAASLMLNSAVGVLLTLISVAAIRPLMRMLNVPQGVFDDAYSYIVILLAGILTTIAYNMCSGMLRAVGNSRTPLYFLIFACGINLAMDLLFVAALGWGIQGAAIATVIAQGCSAALSGWYILTRYRWLLPHKEHFRVGGALLREAASSGFAMAIMLCVVDMGSVIYQRAINHLGESLIVAHTAARRLIGIFTMPQGSIATAYSTFVSQNWGAGKRYRVRRSIKNAMAMELGWGAVAGLFSILFGSLMVRLLTGTSDTYIIKNAVFSLRLHLLCAPSLGVLLALRTALQAMGRKVIPVVSSGFELGIKIISGFWLIPAFGFIAACMTEPVIWIVCALFLVAVFLIAKPLSDDGHGMQSDPAFDIHRK